MSKIWNKYNKKIQWSLILLLATILFVISMFTSNPLYLMYSLLLALLVRYKGNDVLFGNYDKKIRNMRERYKR